MFKENEGVPIYLQLKEKYISQIKNGDLKEGDKIPSERDLALAHNVSRMTARNAITQLEREGYVERRVGMGTFVTTRKFKWNFITVNSLTKSMQEKGFRPSAEILKLEKGPADEIIADALHITPGELIIAIHRLRLVDGVPIAVEISQIPYQFCEGIENHMLNDVSLYQVLEDHYDIRLKKQQQHMRIASSNTEQSKLLKIQQESPCLLIRATTTDTDDRIVEYAQTFARGDIVEFYSETISDH